MTVREHFRQLRREQWETDMAWFDRMRLILDPPKAEFNGISVVAGHVYEIVWHVPPSGVALAAFFKLHEAVVFGEIRLAPLVAPAASVFTERWMTYGVLTRRIPL